MFNLLANTNFNFLGKYLPELSTLGGFAEKYVYSDPQSAAVKLRSYAERYVQILYQILNIKADDYNANLFAYLDNPEFKKAVPKTILHHLHFLRMNGNKGAHASSLSSEVINEMLNSAFRIGQWLYLSYTGGKRSDVPNFRSPHEEREDMISPAMEEIEAMPSIDEKLADYSRIEKVNKLDEVKELYESEKNLEQTLEEFEKERIQNLKSISSSEQKHELYEKSIKVADELSFSEEETRRFLIDNMLSSAGWNVGPNQKDTDEVKQEYPIEHQPTESGIGYADYVLFDSQSNKPLAVIEVKKTSKSPKIGKKQAQLYADGLEKMTGYRPMIFFTNGYETFIWNDTAYEPERRIYGLYSKDSIQYLLFQRKERQNLSEVKINYKITDRPYQIEAIKRVTEKFQSKGRKALIVQATGTGKTRVAVSLCDVLSRANAVKRILFLCDRRELRKQAKNVFSEFLTGLPLTILNANTYKDRDKRIYLATYPAMLQYYQNFDVGFFDMIIADESHRSIYKVYRDIFEYFDSYQVGLTATPVNFVNRNTFQIFECKQQDPTAHYSYDEAVMNVPPYLSRYEVYNVTTKFLREGIKYKELTKEQQEEIEEQVGDPHDSIEYDAKQIDKYIFNKDTNRHIIRNLMENGKKLPDGRLGKSIIFARNHRHAVLLKDVFNEMYPQFSSICEVIDNYDPRADQLIDDLKGIGTNPNLTIGISVDMLDTGIDIPELLNLVFAKPVKSYVKFWQMIGRGTRICRDLFGPGEDKEEFRIFDHWSNFEWFDLHYKQVEPEVSKSLMQRLFETRVKLAEDALTKFEKNIFNNTVELIYHDLNTLAEVETIAIKENLKTIKQLQSKDLLEKFSSDTVTALRNTIAPLIQWINIRGFTSAYYFDLLMTEMQNALLLKASKFKDLKDELINQVNSLKKNINQVKAKADLLKEIISIEYWKTINFEKLEHIRIELRSIMKFREVPSTVELEPPILDVSDSDLTYDEYKVQNKGIKMAAYKERVEDVLVRLIDKSRTLQKIKSGSPVNETDIQELISLVLTQHPDVNLEMLQEFYPDTAKHLDLAIRRIIGLNPEFLDKQFTEFIHQNPKLNPTQLRFIQMLKTHLTKYGALKIESLFEPPFTNVHSEGIYGAFNDERQVNQLINIVKEINYPYDFKQPDK